MRRSKRRCLSYLQKGFFIDMHAHRLKSASPARQEQARLEVENAEDDLVQKTEVAITLMKTVLENVSDSSPFSISNNEPNRDRFSPSQSRT